ncbi:class I SAM-dependent methyltransferase [Halobaculum sp. EA56]|uniref:class I SAM-dependent methyltransferase n=1 Tax=Halobaculum sp. EA56 TaxID=3421648 RepID=UPI003EBA7CCF
MTDTDGVAVGGSPGDAPSEPPPGDVYDRWSRHPRAMDLLYAVAFLGRGRTVRRRSLAALDLDAGERVLEVGCGDGRTLDALADGVGPGGAVVGLDASRGMTRAAADRTADRDAVEVVRGDARRLPVPEGSIDGAYAAMSLSAVPDPAAAVEAVHDALRPGGRFVVLDAQPFPRWPLRALNAVTVPLARRLTDWVPEVDLREALEGRFARVDVSTFNGGSILIVRAERADRDRDG